MQKSWLWIFLALFLSSACTTQKEELEPEKVPPLNKLQNELLSHFNEATILAVETAHYAYHPDLETPDFYAFLETWARLSSHFDFSWQLTDDTKEDLAVRLKNCELTYRDPTSKGAVLPWQGERKFVATGDECHIELQEIHAYQVTRGDAARRGMIRLDQSFKVLTAYFRNLVDVISIQSVGGLEFSRQGSRWSIQGQVDSLIVSSSLGQVQQKAQLELERSSEGASVNFIVTNHFPGFTAVGQVKSGSKGELIYSINSVPVSRGVFKRNFRLHFDMTIPGNL